MADKDEIKTFVWEHIRKTSLREKMVWMGEVELERLKKKPDRRLLVIGRYKFFLFGGPPKYLKNMSKLREAHWFDLSEIYSSSNDKFALKFKASKKSKEPVAFILRAEAAKCKDIIKIIRQTIREITYNFPEEETPKINVIQELQATLDPYKVLSPIQALIDTYYARCSYNKIDVSTNFVFWLENLVFNTTKDGVNNDMDVSDCPGSDTDSNINIDFKPLMQALRYNDFFKSFVARNVQRKELAVLLGDTLKYNNSITKVVFRKIGCDSSSITNLAIAFEVNKDHSVQVLDVADNKFGDKGAMMLSNSIKNFTHGLTHLNFSNCGLTGKGITFLFSILERNWGLSLTLEYLNLSQNKFDELSSLCLERWIFAMNANSRIKHLILNNTGVMIGVSQDTRDALKLLTSLVELDLSHNKLDTNTTSESSLLLISLVGLAPNLAKLNLSNCNLTSQTGTALLESLATNDITKYVEVDLSGNNLESIDISKALRGSSPIKGLNLSGVKFKEKHYITIIEALTRSNVHHVLLDNVFSTKPQLAVTLALCTMLTTNQSLRSLSLAGGYGKGTILPILKILETSNFSLTSLNISNNSLGDEGGEAIGVCLRYNCFITHINCDRNDIKWAGWQAIRTCLKTNKNLASMTYPLHDIERESTSRKEKMFECMTGIQKSLQNGFAFSDKIYSDTIPATPVGVTPLAQVPQYLQSISLSLPSVIRDNLENIEKEEQQMQDELAEQKRRQEEEEEDEEPEEEEVLARPSRVSELNIAPKKASNQNEAPVQDTPGPNPFEDSDEEVNTSASNTNPFEDD